MDVIGFLSIDNMSSQLAKRGSIYGWIEHHNYIVWHYNGPAIDQRRDWDAHIKWLADYHTNTVEWGWANGQPIYGNGIMYHYVVLPDGRIVQTREKRGRSHDVRWHAGNVIANEQGIAIHVPIGGSQEPSEAQTRSLFDLTSHLAVTYGIPADRVTGHCEWSQNSCPGIPLMERLKAWKASPPVVLLPNTMRYTIKIPSGAYMRVRPYTSSSLKEILKDQSVRVLGFGIGTNIKVPVWYIVETESGVIGWIHHSGFSA